MIAQSKLRDPLYDIKSFCTQIGALSDDTLTDDLCDLGLWARTGLNTSPIIKELDEYMRQRTSK